MKATVAMLALAIPAIAGALLVIALEGRAELAPSATSEADGTFADVLVDGGPERGWAFVQAGVDPNVPTPFRHETLTAGRTVMVAPLLIAVSGGNENAVMMLMSAGAQMDLPRNRLAICLARRLGKKNLEELLVRDGPVKEHVACPPEPADASTPLLDFIE